MTLHMLIFRVAALFLAMSLPACVDQRLNGRSVLDDPATYVSRFENFGDTSISETMMRGSVRNIDYSIAAKRTEAHIIFDISLAGRSVQLRLRREDFPEMDLRTIREGVASDNEPHTLRFAVEFSELGGCIKPPTTPKKLSIRYNVEGLLSGSWDSVEGCELVLHELNLVQVGPATYSAVVRQRP
jgi:hypothetical protein